MKHLVAGFAAVVLMLITSGPSEAQQAGRSIADLPQHISTGATVFVTDRQGREIRGALQRLSTTSLVVFVAGDEREIFFSEIIRIEKPDSIWNGVLLGALPGALLFMGGAGASCSPHCASAVTAAALGGAALGGFLGARLDRAHEGRTLVYGSRLSTPDTLRPGGSVASIVDLPMKLRTGDAIDVLDAGGRIRTGIFAHASSTSMAFSADGQVREIPVEEVRRVRRRGHWTIMGALVGAAAGATGGIYTAECRQHFGDCFWSGTALGTVIGRFIPKHTVVYGSTPATTVRFMPVISPGRSGVSLWVKF